MPIFRLRREPVFPDAGLAEPDGLLAVGGDLSPERVLTAYAQGIFPWYGDDEPILWWSPDPRFVLPLSGLHVSRSLRRTLRRGQLEVTADTAFAEVVSRCARARRPRQRGTWITADMRRAYEELHELGFAHSVETRQDGQLVGGLYGVSLGGTFFGESMFSQRPDASKVALVALVSRLRRWGFDLLDCQLETEHLKRLGAIPLARAEFLARLEASLAKPTRQGSWTDDFTGPPEGPGDEETS